ncbi:hypothetical protein [Candidatus Uabimicrobium amorphum]|uniref:Uncharacterized protein n=1 Tax=Uabimicrobium amorphum TaxID=2596890 RepID=A0A5S9ISZ5_UABAM|nr:hypothetical protein [Candidatus Uabimicrobium amorphum]BBM87374.1 hypothetical protein UABAM_05783 [Candidatus Uabimicrobium amorphum]
MKIISALVVFIVAMLWWLFVSSSITIKVNPNMEDMLNNERYTPSTQSFLRGKHWLEDVGEITICADHDATSVEFHNAKDHKHRLSLKNIPLRLLVPRLHYKVEIADDFDAFNLMMAEYSRNGISVPVGSGGDSIAHFETNFEFSAPWKLKKDYEFEANPHFRPLRMGITNNCLSPGLWELNATDRAGEIYHSWFNMPENVYINTLASVNGVRRDFAKKALEWHTKNIALKLERLRKLEKDLGKHPIKFVDGVIGFSSQDSRRKLHKNYVKVEKAGVDIAPKYRREFVDYPVKMSDFIAPGKYSCKKNQEFDFGFLKQPIDAQVQMVKPQTHYNMETFLTQNSGEPYIEITIDLGKEKIIIGNLPLFLVVQQEDFQIHGFGVGVLSNSDFAERRKILIEKGPHPSFAYLAVWESEKLFALNSHDRGLEQIFIRAYPFTKNPYWEITITSFERIVDIVKYQIQIPKSLQQQVKKYTTQYITPSYFGYRDDNLR